MGKIKNEGRGMNTAYFIPRFENLRTPFLHLNKGIFAMKSIFSSPSAALGFVVSLAVLLHPFSAQAELLYYDAFLDGLQEVPPNASPGTGMGSIVLDDVLMQITVDESWSDLLSPATASHIHGPALPGINAPIIFALSGVSGATSGSIPTQSFPITPTQLGYLQTGQLYFNVHTVAFPGGEIRGQIYEIPEPGACVLLCAGALGLAFYRSRRKHN
jgi:hypothetical protein